MSRTRAATSVLAAVLALTACTPGGGGAANTGAKSQQRTTHAALVVTRHIWPGSLQPPAGFDWRPVPGSPYLAVATMDGDLVSLMWIDAAHLKFRYVPGFKYPEGSPRSAADVNPNTWVNRMVAAFDGGFKLADHVGGYYYLGQQVSPLLPGLATLIVYSNGTMRIGVWGRDMHSVTDAVVIRQNQPPFVDHGVVQTKPTDSYRTWGFTFHHRWLVNRSALGQRSDGTLVFAYGHSVRPVTMASYLASAGVVTAINLDMNGYFPAGFVYQQVGTKVVGVRINRFVIHPPSVYFKPYQKDFFVVEAR